MSHETNTVAWWRLLNRYQWFVLIVAAAGWLLDCMDQQLFNLARTPAMKELLKGTFAPDATPGQIAASVQEHAGYSTAIFLLGWATGGLIFGVLGDRIGRAKTMMITILIYSLCTGLSALATSFWDFAFYRFITGLGVGGEGGAWLSNLIFFLENDLPPQSSKNNLHFHKNQGSGTIEISHSPEGPYKLFHGKAIFNIYLNWIKKFHWKPLQKIRI